MVRGTTLCGEWGRLSVCGEWGRLSVCGEGDDSVVRGTTLCGEGDSSLAVVRRTTLWLWFTGFRSYGTWTQFLYDMWDLPGSGIELVSPVLARRFFTTEQPGKPPK